MFPNRLSRDQASAPPDPTRTESSSAPNATFIPGSDGGPEPTTTRVSLYERLLRSGALDDNLTGAETSESSRPLQTTPPRPRTTPELPSPADVHGLAEVLEGGEGRDRSAPWRSDSPGSPAEVLAGGEGRDSPEALEGGDGRDSAEALCESDLHFVPHPARAPRRPASPPLPRRLPAPIPIASTLPFANSLAPTALPAAAKERSPTWWLAGGALLVGVVAAVGLLHRDPAPPSAALIDNKPTAVAAPALSATREPAVTEFQSAAPVPAEAPAVPAEHKRSALASPADEGTEALESRAHSRAHSHRARRAQVVAGAPAALQSSVPVATDVETPAVPSPTAAADVATSASPLPPRLSRAQVVATMEGVVPSLTACVGTKHGTAHVTMTVRATGRVSYALVGGSFAGTPEGSCIARVITQARFPAFSEPSMRVAYPIPL